MWVFQDITNRYCKKILDAYQLQANEKTYIGYEAGLLEMRNEFARCLIETIYKLEVTNNNDYFKQVLKAISSTLEDLKKAVNEYNTEKNTQFTTDLYETLFTTSLINLVNVINELYLKSPALITNIVDETLFANNQNTSWFNQLSFVLYEYILKKELALSIDNSNRDIFDAKKQLVFKYIQNAADLSSRFDNEDASEYQNLMNGLLQGIRSEEHDLQQRRDNSYGFGYFAQTFHRTSEKLMGKGQLGLEIDLLIKAYKEKTMHSNSLIY